MVMSSKTSWREDAGQRESIARFEHVSFEDQLIENRSARVKGVVLRIDVAFMIATGEVFGRPTWTFSLLGSGGLRIVHGIT
jgi:hypothetical protein